MRPLLATALLGLMLAASPLALAQDSNESESKPGDSEPQRPDDAAWTEDCPPDMMCAYGGDGNASHVEEPTYGDCGGEVCAYRGDACADPDTPVSSDDGATPMVGSAEACDPDVRYSHAGDGREPALAESADASPTNAVPLPAVPVVFAALAVAVLLVRRA